MFHFPYLSLSHSATLPLCQTHFPILFWSSLFAFACPQNFVQPTLLSRCYYLFISWVCLSCRKMQASVNRVRETERTREVFYFSPELSSTIIHYFSFFLTISSSLSQIVVFKYRLCGGRSIYLINHSICICINQHLCTHRVIS